MLAVGILGAAGRMGRILVDAVCQATDMTLAGVTVRPGHWAEGLPLASLYPHYHDHPVVQTLCCETDATRLSDVADVLIDFTTPSYTLAVLPLAQARSCAMVIGTTGFAADDYQTLKEATSFIPILYGANMNPVLLVMEEAIQHLAQRLTRSEGFDIEILETHHRYKRDAPSGTAIALAQAAAKGREVALDKVAVWQRHGMGTARQRDDIGFACMRGGNILGEHRAAFLADGQSVTIEHRAWDRSIYAEGALAVARWLGVQPPGWYGMRDWWTAISTVDSTV